MQHLAATKELKGFVLQPNSLAVKLAMCTGILGKVWLSGF